uniref:(northern house mosquito) hypothetical protein n=1 Tax=Culex pipiens TaxID=7175 RepID=A0A8D8EZW3_CULPI
MMADKKNKINRSILRGRISLIRMSTFDSNESFDNKIYLVYWLWLKMNESEILDMTVVQSEILQGTRMCKQSKTKRTDKFISFQKGSQLFSIDCTFFLDMEQFQLKFTVCRETLIRTTKIKTKCSLLV